MILSELHCGEGKVGAQVALAREAQVGGRGEAMGLEQRHLKDAVTVDHRASIDVA